MLENPEKTLSEIVREMTEVLGRQYIFMFRFFFISFYVTLFPEGELGEIFDGYVQLAYQNPYPSIVNIWSVLLPIEDPILVTSGRYSQFLSI